jgi:hypothetical protein
MSEVPGQRRGPRFKGTVAGDCPSRLREKRCAVTPDVALQRVNALMRPGVGVTDRYRQRAIPQEDT